MQGASACYGGYSLRVSKLRYWCLLLGELICRYAFATNRSYILDDPRFSIKFTKTLYNRLFVLYHSIMSTIMIHEHLKWFLVEWHSKVEHAVNLVVANKICQPGHI
jgi:hypothetical protein